MKPLKGYMLPFITAALMTGTMGFIPSSALTVISAEADSGYTYQVSSDGQSVEITKYTGSAWELTIPAELDGKPVTAIGNYAFSRNGILNSVTIPDSVKRIGNCAFTRCSRLTYVSIP